MADWTDHNRPETVADCLRAVAVWLDLADRAFAILAADKGIELPVGATIQGDLKMLATWLEIHPEIDQSMHSVLDSSLFGE